MVNKTTSTVETHIRKTQAGSQRPTARFEQDLPLKTLSKIPKGVFAVTYRSVLHQFCNTASCCMEKNILEKKNVQLSTCKCWENPSLLQTVGSLCLCFPKAFHLCVLHTEYQEAVGPTDLAGNWLAGVGWVIFCLRCAVSKVRWVLKQSTANHGLGSPLWTHHCLLHRLVLLQIKPLEQELYQEGSWKLSPSPGSLMISITETLWGADIFIPF